MSDLALLDTNVLVYAVVPDAPQHEAARRLSDRALAGEIAACVTPQVLFEFFATVSNPRRVTPAQSPEALWATVDLYRRSLAVLPVPADIIERTQALAAPLGIGAQDIFDVQIAATMLAQAQPVTRLYTYDSAVFGRIPGIAVLAP